MRNVFVVTDDATLGSAGDSPPHLGEYFLDRLLVIPLPSVSSSAQVFFAQVGLYILYISQFYILYILLNIKQPTSAFRLCFHWPTLTDRFCQAPNAR